MDHKTALNLILANTCPNDIRDDGRVEFSFDLCCATATVEAKLTSEKGATPIEYEIHSVEIDRS